MTVVVVEAAAGYGKSVLAAELVELWGAVAIDVLLEEDGVSAGLLAARLRAAAARAGLADAAAAMVAAGADAAGAIDAMAARLRGESCAVVIDDAHHAERSAAALIDRIAVQLQPPAHLVVLARALPPGSLRLRRAGPLHLDADDLALEPDETLEICRTGFGLQTTDEDGRLLHRLTGGWTAAAVLAASRANRSGLPLDAVMRAGRERPRGRDPVASILDELLESLGRDRCTLAQIGRLPLLDRELLGVVTGRADWFDRALAAGLPLSCTDGRWWRLPGPVRDHLSALGEVDPDTMLRAAAVYQERGELATALHMLLAGGGDESAARLLAAAEPTLVEAVDVHELLAVIDRIPAAVLDRHPRAMLHAARSCAGSMMLQQRARLLARMDQVVAEDSDPPLRRALEAELAIDLLDAGRPTAAEAPARRVLESAGPDEQLTRARALTAIGVATCARRDDERRLTPGILRAAADYLDQAYDVYLSLGYREAASGLAAQRAVGIELGLGRPEKALEVLDAALALVADRPRRFTRLLFFRAHVLTELGRFQESDSTLAEVLRIAQLIGYEWMVAYYHLQHLILASLRGDSAGALHHAALVEAHRGDWWEVAGAEFLARAADCLDRVGHTALASEYLARARENPQDAEPYIVMAQGALLARHGDPVAAEEHLLTAAGHGVAPSEYWRVTLLRAYAAWRRGDPQAGALGARALEEAARLGQPQAPLVREREITEALLALAAETGLPAAQALEGSSLPLALAVLGRFELTRGGQPISLAVGQPAQLLKLVAVSEHTRVGAERAIESLWPEVDPAAGRNRLRTVLGRLREVAGEVIARDGNLLALAPDVRLDLAGFHRDACQALALAAGEAPGALSLARSAIARYRGDVLPHDAYEDWADEPRERARRTMLELLDYCAEAAARAGDLDEARRMVERAIELDPYDDDRYLRVASILCDQGRRGAALSVLRRARSSLSQLGVPLPRQLLELEESLVA